MDFILFISNFVLTCKNHRHQRQRYLNNNWTAVKQECGCKNVWTSEQWPWRSWGVLFSVCFFLPQPRPLLQGCWCHFLFSLQGCVSALMLHIDFSKSIDWTSFVLSCVSCTNCFVSSAAAARAEECFWWSHPGCARAARDPEKEEMLYILKCWTLFTHAPCSLWMSCCSN